ncbi:protein phosphatase 2C domain-containing protein [Georgenia sp. TF02-10]|uniref:PP2C family protein-serine/threonine phosphatase n=1 Tax=Georgenia sp. TF02-10 TaxID=2917725 RepID=UPI001FA777D5|nr:PP2C family serine/threonine-protein phosphatase [Georgenia sp. TF02-10]UNX54996.1 protein phosphatase 2C domain-containing protein [Georgenia sp. TF02-10]
MSVALRYAARSDTGLVRSSNQDSGYAGPHLLVLADGMGGPAGGDIASSVAVAHLAPLDGESHGGDDLLDLLRGAVAAAHADLMERSEADEDLAGLGTTCIAVLRSGNKLAMVHIGDSRAYLLRDGVLTQVTTDHTFVQYLVSTGRLTPEEAERHPQRNVILRALGDNDGDVELDESLREAVPGDRWLLASDGLFGVVSDETIAETLASVADPGACADELIALALRAGGPDNVTCVVADVVPGGPAAPTSPEVVGAAGERRNGTRGGHGAAARAAALVSAARPAAVEEEDPPRPRRHRWVGRVVAAVLVLAVLAGAGWAGYSWTRTQYFVAPAGEHVAIYRGIPQEVGPVRLAELHERTDLRVADLSQVAQDRLTRPITRGSLAAAEEVVANLRASETDDGDGAREPTPSPSPSPSPTPTPARPTTPRPTLVPTSPPAPEPMPTLDEGSR